MPCKDIFFRYEINVIFKLKIQEMDFHKNVLRLNRCYIEIRNHDFSALLSEVVTSAASSRTFEACVRLICCALLGAAYYCVYRVSFSSIFLVRLYMHGVIFFNNVFVFNS